MLTYQVIGDQLILKGDLNYQTFNSLWAAKIEWNAISSIDLSQVAQLDSIGLALLVDWSIHHSCALVGMNDKMDRLIDLYDLEEVIGLPLNSMTK